jgi:hypothetical protein
VLGTRTAIRMPLTLTLAAHESRDTLVATAHATAHAHAGQMMRIHRQSHPCVRAA